MSKTLKKNNVQHFLTVYFYLLEKHLNNSENGLDKVKFQSEEANTDEHLKRYFKAYLLQNNGIPKTDIKSVTIQNDKEISTVQIEELKFFQIVNVFLPEELPVELRKKIVTTKKSMFTSPDLFMEIVEGKNTYFESLELKSTKSNKISGSSIQQVYPYEWVIFIKRNKESVTISTGYYINSITEKLPFPDRSPRPQIGFKTLSDWNATYRIEKKYSLYIENLSKLNETKLKLITDWQDYLASEWLHIIQSDKALDNEKWFNNALRKFAVKFLEHTENLSPLEREKLKDTLNSLIK